MRARALPPSTKPPPLVKLPVLSRFMPGLVGVGGSGSFGPGDTPGRVCASAAGEGARRRRRGEGGGAGNSVVPVPAADCDVVGVSAGDEPGWGVVSATSITSETPNAGATVAVGNVDASEGSVRERGGGGGRFDGGGGVRSERSRWRWCV